MLFINSKLKVVDNSGARSAKVINFTKIKSSKNIIGKLITITLKKINRKSKTKLNKKKIYTSLIISLPFWHQNDKSGILFKCSTALTILVDKSGKALFTKINCSFPKHFVYMLKKNTFLYQKLVNYIKKTF